MRFDTATAAAAQILDQLTEGDQVALLVTCGPAFPDADKLDRTQDTVRQMLAQCRVSYERADLGLKVQQARELLAKSDAPNKQIYVLTDMQKVSWEGLKGKAEGGRRKTESESPSPAGRGAGGEGGASETVQSNRHRPHPSPLPKGEGTSDSPLPKRRADQRRPRPPSPSSSSTATARRSRTWPSKASTWKRRAGGRPAGQGDRQLAERLDRVPAAARGIADRRRQGGQQPRVEHAARGPSEARVSVHVQRAADCTAARSGWSGEDGSKYDDRRFFAMEVDQGIPVAIVRSQRHEIPYLDDAYYLEQALAPGRGGGWAVQPRCAGLPAI